MISLCAKHSSMASPTRRNSASPSKSNTIINFDVCSDYFLFLKYLLFLEELLFGNDGKLYEMRGCNEYFERM